MPGVQTLGYGASTMDLRIQYAPWSWAIARFVFPTNFRTLTNMPVKITVPGGGWNDDHSYRSNDIHDPYAAEFAALTFDTFLAAGWVCVYMELPPGHNININSRFAPTARYPRIEWLIGKCVQFCKTHATDGFLTGSMSSTLATESSRYIIEGTSSGGIEASHIALLPSGFLPFDHRIRHHSGKSPYQYRYDHRVRGVANSNGIADFSKFRSASVSADALPRFGVRERFYNTPAFSEISHDEKRDLSFLSLIEPNYAENRHVGFFLSFVDSSVPSGQSAPVLGATGSYLGSGTIVVHTAAITGSFQVGETVNGSGGGTGVFKGRNATKGYLYIERTTTAVFSGTITGATSGATVTAGSTLGNNDRLAFLDEDAALAVYDAADTAKAEITDCTHVHEMLLGLVAKRALERNEQTNATSLHRFYMGNDYVASLDSGNVSDFVFNGLTQQTELLDWATDDLGIDT